MTPPGAPPSTPLPPCLRPPAVVREPEEDGLPWNERHLQCIWADARLRPALATTGGLPVRVLDPGRWNGGGGPDFRGAVVEIGGAVRRGDVEVHVRAGDWFAHGHDRDPAYRDVVLHLAWYPPAPGEAAPEVPLALLRDAMRDRPGFSFDQIDPASYPRPAGSDLARPCRDALRGAAPAEVAALLERAGRSRASAQMHCRWRSFQVKPAVAGSRAASAARRHAGNGTPDGDPATASAPARSRRRSRSSRGTCAARA